MNRRIESSERAPGASHANGPPSREALRRGLAVASAEAEARRRSGARESVSGSPRGEAPRTILGLFAVRDVLEPVVVPGIAETSVLGAPVVQPDLLTDLGRALHVAAALGTLVQLLPPPLARGRLVGH